MSLNTDLQTLKTNIEGVKSTLYTNLTNKGVTNIAETDTLSTLADKVATITVGEGGSGGSGIDFRPIGYDAELSAELNAKFNSDVAYSKTLYDAWNPSKTSASNLYKEDTKLVYAPNIDTSNVTRMDNMFFGCSSLTTIPMFDTSKVNDMYQMLNGCSSIKSVPMFDTSNATNFGSMFQGCSSLTTIPMFDTSKVTSMYQMFNGCKSLTSVTLFDTSNVESMEKMFYNCSSLTTIEGISFKSFTASTMSTYYLCGYSRITSLRKAVFKDIGYQSTAVQFNTEYIANWGVNTSEIPDARQSVIDSLITYSFDRATAGYPTCTIKLSTNTKALLTADEIAQITAKGFTIA